MKKLLTILALSVPLLVGCGVGSVKEEVELTQTKYNGPIKITLSKKNMGWEYDRYRLEFRDSTGNVMAFYEAGLQGVNKAQIQLEDGRVYDLSKKGIIIKTSKTR